MPSNSSCTVRSIHKRFQYFWCWQSFLFYSTNNSSLDLWWKENEGGKNKESRGRKWLRQEVDYVPISNWLFCFLWTNCWKRECYFSSLWVEIVNCFLDLSERYLRDMKSQSVNILFLHCWHFLSSNFYEWNCQLNTFSFFFVFNFFLPKAIFIFIRLCEMSEGSPSPVYLLHEKLKNRLWYSFQIFQVLCLPCQ